MTTANKITVLRILLIPIMIIVVAIPQLRIETNFFGLYLDRLIFAAIFIFAAGTDFVDGYIARKYNQITTFGKFLDPIADKILVFTALLYLMTIDSSRVPLWTVVLILVREFAVTGIRLLAVEKQAVIAASFWGKLKTMTTMIAIIVLLFNDFNLPHIIGDILYYSAVAITLISGIDYFIKNRKVVLESL